MRSRNRWLLWQMHLRCGSEVPARERVLLRALCRIYRPKMRTWPSVVLRRVRAGASDGRGEAMTAFLLCPSEAVADGLCVADGAVSRFETSLPTLCMALRDAGANDGFDAFKVALLSGRFVEQRTGPGTALYSLDVDDPLMLHLGSVLAQYERSSKVAR